MVGWPQCHTKIGRIEMSDCQSLIQKSHASVEQGIRRLAGWWFATLFVSEYIGKNHPN